MPQVFFVGEPKLVQAIKTALDALELIRNSSNDITSAALAHTTFVKVAELAAEHWDKMP
jgi:hypothetical protein